MDENKTIQAIELYRKANHYLEAARLLMGLAKEETTKHSSPLRIKKLYVLGALLVEEHQSNIRKNTKGTGVRSTAALMRYIVQINTLISLFSYLITLMVSLTSF